MLAFGRPTRPRHNTGWAEVDLGPKNRKWHLTANNTRAQRSDTVCLVDEKMERKRAMKICNFKRELLLNIFWMIRSKIKMNWIFDITYFVFPERTCHLVCFNVVPLFRRIDILLRVRIEVDVTDDRLHYMYRALVRLLEDGMKCFLLERIFACSFL